MSVTQIHGNDQIQAGTVSNGVIAASAGIVTTKLADGAKFIQRDGSVVYTADQPHGGFKITGLGDPSNPQDAATKAYVDAIAIGLDVKASVRVATTANGALASAYENGDTIDGVVLATGNRILIKNQTTPAENGIYTVNASGAPTRATDADVSAEVTGGLFTFVTEGTVNGDSGWVLTTNDPIVLGTTGLTFTQFSGPGAIAAGDGLTLTGSTLNVVAGNAGIGVNANDIFLAQNGTGIGQRRIRETPIGTVDGVNTSFSLAAGLSKYEEVFLNGILQEPGGEDYTITDLGGGAFVDFDFVVAPKTGARIRVNSHRES